MTTNKQGSTPHYWYGPEAERERAVAVLEAMRAYGAADAAMQRRSEQAMRMSENDISALRYLLRANERGVNVGPKELADYLGVQSSSITILLDRLEKAGHVRREPSPFDRRALIIVPTVPTDELHKAILGDIREELVEVAASLSDEDADTIVDFIDRLRDAVDHIDSARPATDRAGDRTADRAKH
ncbi:MULTISPECIES: MarR family transcriptional regulator [unclassified Leifsonia]|uniref:MarR family winged helix-turn-helix transcriptional regulator n=1 Tax=unclassified Leifsonia TaxID=2663824 RepID=UPI000A192642|nr:MULTISPECIES: MarR family transcriptional regulator [unclassified Leifsonia]QIZ97550.1 MarR family transcriptional regulator [Leifsonia sp. PS1209]